MPRRNKRSHNTDMSAEFDALALSSPTHATMIGCSCPYGPGGRDCTCCGDAPGKARVAARRAKKRSKRQEFKHSLKGYYRSAREYYEYAD
nr:MAG TPA: hypothetical protein [Caudoviricetes sp.]